MIKRYWAPIAARIDDMTLRQRAMLFATISLALVAVAHVLFLEPLLVRQKSLIERSKRDQSQVAAVRAQIGDMLKRQEGDSEQAGLRDLEKRTAEAEQALTAKKQAFAAATRLPTLLQDLLGQARGVKLEVLRVLPGAQVEGASQLYRHGVEMTLTGSYQELLQYLSRLEALPVRLLWGPGDLQVDQYPTVRLRLQVHTLSTQRSLAL
jgi:MSHA biogenesis protein MshJ